MRRNDMDEPPPLEDGSSYGQKNKHKNRQNDPHNLEERFYRYGVKPEWLAVHRIINHRSTRDGTSWYLTKWKDLSYDSATWETEESGIADFTAEIDKYLSNRLVVMNICYLISSGSGYNEKFLSTER